MHFMYGSTRWVILTNRYAIKIARIRPIRPFVRLLQLLKKREIKQKLERYDPGIVRALIKYVGAGVRANRTEYMLYKKYGDELLAPTLFTIGWIINIQKRGEPLNEENACQHRLWPILQRMNTSLTEEILRPEQFCVIGSKVYLADYGYDSLEPLLSQNTTPPINTSLYVLPH